jgi:hypothetical protein
MFIRSLLFSAACLFTTASFAQDNHPPMVPDHDFAGGELMIGHGFLPSNQIFSGSYRNASYTNSNYTGALFASYKYELGGVVSLGLTVAYEHESGTYTDNRYYNYLYTGGYSPYNYGTTGSFRRSSITIAPEITFNYGDFGDGLVRLYSVIGMGYTYRHELVTESGINTEYTSPYVSPLHFNGYISPIGIRFGRRLSGFFELGLGYKGVFNYGLSYRF